MSAPDTNLTEQTRRHKPALVIIRGVVVVAALGLAALLGAQFIGSDGPEGADAQATPLIGVETN